LENPKVFLGSAVTGREPNQSVPGGIDDEAGVSTGWTAKFTCPVLIHSLNPSENDEE
jgi:hypothetical protein